MWGRVFRCNMDEVREPLHSYPTLADFFARQLKDGAREICKGTPTQPITKYQYQIIEGMASPVDGKVLSRGVVTSDLLEHIKGKTYSLSAFLGSKMEDLKRNTEKNTKLYYCVVSTIICVQANYL